MTKRIYLALALLWFVGVLPQAWAQASQEKGATTQKPAAKDEKAESLPEGELNFPQAEGPVELRAPHGTRITLKATDASRALYEAIGRQARISVLFDPDYTPRNITVDMENVPLLDALKIVAFESRTFWRPVTSDSIFVAQDTQAKRREFEQQLLKTFYFPNITTPTDLQDIVNTIRTIVEVQRIQQQPGFQTIVVRATPQAMAITERLVDEVNRAKQKTGGEYRVEYKIMENTEDKKASSNVYTMLIEPHQTAKLRIGAKVPIDAGENKKSYTDVGKNIDCTVISETEHTVTIRMTVESSEIAADEHGAKETMLGNPVIRGTRIETNVTLALGTPTVVGSFQDPISKRNIQIEATATRTKSKEQIEGR
jgi:hypothetical protein